MCKRLLIAALRAAAVAICLLATAMIVVAAPDLADDVAYRLSSGWRRIVHEHVIRDAHATLTTTTSVAQYTSNGSTTVYSFPYKFLDVSHLVVTKTDLSAVTTTLVLGTDYSVTGANLTAGGSVTLTAAIPNNWTLKIKRSTPKTQTCNFRTSAGAPNGSAIEACLDRLEMQAQEMNDGTFTSLITTPVTTAQASMAAPSTIPNSTNTNVAGSSASFAAADHSHALAVGPMLSASTAAGQSIPNNAFTIAVFGTVQRDSDSAYNNVTGRYTVPTGKGGDYSIAAAIAWASAITGNGAIAIYKNAAEVWRVERINPAAVDTQLIAAILNLAAGDIIDIRVFQNSGGSIALRSSVATANYFTLKRIQ